MTKKMWSLLLTGALIAGVFSAAPALAATEIPGTVQIDDPKGDANGLNDQDNAYGTPLAGQGDHTEVGVGTSTDLLKVWFTNDASSVSLHFQTNGNPENLAYDTYFRFSSNPGTGSVAADETRGCLQWVASVNGAAGAYTGETEGVLTDKCNVGTPVAGPLLTEEGPDGTFITTLTFPRDYSPLLADGGSITAPFGVSRILYYGPTPQTGAFVTMDNTQRGTDYAIASGGAPTAPPVVQEPPGKNDPPGQGNQNCAKIKDKKKKKACKKNSGKGPKTPPGDKCADYAPGEQGAEAETLVVDSKTSAEAPLEHEISMGPAVGLLTGNLPVVNQPNPATSETFINMQVDSDQPTDGLFVRVEFPHGEDYDIYLNNADGTEAARAGGFNQAPDPTIGDGTGNGGHSEEEAEQLDGVLTNDCGGYTLKIANAFGTGAPVLKLWLGTPTWDPASQAAIPAKAFVR